jgi:hypothetical protein
LCHLVLLRPGAYREEIFIFTKIPRYSEYRDSSE